MTTEQQINIQTARWAPGEQPESVISFLKRPAVDPKAEETAGNILRAVRQEGDEAVIRFAREHDGAQLSAAGLLVQKNEMNEAREKVDNKFIVAAREVHERVLTFAKAGMKKNWSMPSPKGGTLGEQFTPYERVGIYIPGSAPSTAAEKARTASHRLMFICCPRAGPNSGSVRPSRN